MNYKGLDDEKGKMVLAHNEDNKNNCNLVLILESKDEYEE